MADRKKLVCSVCHQEYSSPGSMRRHVETHGDYKAATCPFCNKTFSSKWNLSRHQQVTHANTEKYACNECDQTFGYNWRLTEHRSKKQRRKGGKSRLQYEKPRLLEAYRFVMETGSPLKTAARKFNVPVTTLRSRVKNSGSMAVTNSGLVLNDEEVSKLTAHLTELAEVGYGYTQVEIARKASYYAVELGKKTASNTFCRHWFSKYVSRYADQSRIKWVTIQQQKKLCTSKDCIIEYYSKLGGIVHEYSLGDKPENIYMMDEVNIDVPDEEKCSTVTVVGAGNAVGQKIPPYFVILSGITGEDNSLTRKSHLITEGFKIYLNSNFMKYATRMNENDSILLLFDAHKTHLSIELIQWAKSNHIVLFALPPHTSNIVKTRDDGIIQPVKTKYNRDHGKSSPTSATDVVSILKTIYETEVSKTSLKESFIVWGIYPLQEDKVMCDFLQKQGLVH